MAPFAEIEAHRTTPKQDLSRVATIGEEEWLTPGQTVEHSGVQIQVSSDQLTVDARKADKHKAVFIVPQGKLQYYSSTWLRRDRDQVAPGTSFNVDPEHGLLIFPKGSSWGTMFKWLPEEQKTQDEIFQRRFPLTARFDKAVQYFTDKHSAVAPDWHNKPISLRKVWETIITYCIIPATTVLALPVLAVEFVTIQPATFLYDKLVGLRRKNSLQGSVK